MFFGRNDAKAETPILWPPYAKSWLIGKDSDAGRDCGQEEMGTTEDEMAGWHHWLEGRESGWTPGVGDGQGVLACCNLWGRKELDTTEQLNWNEKNWIAGNCSVAKLCLTICNLMDCSTPGFPVLHYLPEFAQTHVHWFGDAIQPSHPLSHPSLPALNLSQHQDLLK